MSKQKNSVPTAPRFSVIVPTYNRAHVLPRAIGSVLDQTCGDFELIVVDDGSSDDTEGCIGRCRDERIQYVRHHMNLGQNSALNTGIRLAHGELVSFLDSDDAWLPEMLAKVLAKFRSDPSIGCVYTAYRVKDAAGRLTAPIGGSLEGHIYKEALEQAHVCPPSTLSVRRECFDIVGNFGLDVVVCQDDIMCLKLAKHFKFGRVDQVLATLHHDSGARLSDDLAQMADDYYRLYDRFSDDIVEHCGRRTMARHYAHSGMLYLNARNRPMALKAFSLSLARGHSASAVGYILFSLLPDSCQQLVRGFRRKSAGSRRP